MESIGQCPYLASAERISLPESPESRPGFHLDASLSSSERHQVHSTLSQVRGDLALLDDALAHITAIQTQLTKKRDALQAISDRLNAIISPMRAAPPEIIAEIFSYLKGDYRDKVHAHARAESLLPTHVCQQWRRIALSIPSLWNNIYINGGSVSDSIPNSEVECIKVWLARAKNCPLSINLQRLDDWWDDFDFERDDAWNAIFEILLQYSHRWRHAILFSTTTTDFSSLRNNLPLLETLEIKCPIGSDTIFGGNAFEIAPRLVSVTFVAGESTNILPWAQLKVFSADTCVTISESLDFLRRMPNIVSFHAEIHSQESEAMGFTNTPLQLSKLESLSVLENEEFSMTRYLNNLTLPSLKSIKLSAESPFYGNPDDEWVSAAVSMIQRSSCSIKSLEIEGATWNGQSTLGDFLRATPLLETLNIGLNTTYDLDKAMRFLTAPIGICSTPCLTPKLQHLRLLYRLPFEPQAFVDMVSSRWRVTLGGSVVRLRSIKLINILPATIFDFSHLERLGEFAAEGLDIQLNDTEGKPIQIGSTLA
ncbi:hypothetical protein HWV62_36651 [Athelia sp. TMB]|nr:hypothetical protein HWV62_36651 [Athelia sp. TMB]